MDRAQRLAAVVIEDRAELEALAPDWDRLAEGARAPFGAPAWALGWWRHLAPRGARLAVVAVRDADELVGLAPFYASRRFGVTVLRLISAGLASRVDILASRDREREVAAALAGALAGEVRPDLLRWEGVDGVDALGAAALAELARWPGPPALAGAGTFGAGARARRPFIL